MKIVVNRRFGGFSLSPLAIQQYLELKGKQCFFYKQDREKGGYYKVPLEEADTYDNSLTKDYGERTSDDWESFEEGYFYYNDIERNDPDLVTVVERLGGKANGTFANLKVVEIPDDVNWEIDEYDGSETVHEVHRTW